MAEAAVFGVCSVVLATIASPAVRSGYRSIKLIGSALLDLDKLKRRMEEIQAVLLDAEKNQSIPAIKLWVMRVQDVLYQADDLFDEVASYDILRKAEKVRDSPSNLSKRRCKVIKSSVSFARRIAYKKSIAERVKGIGKELDELCRQMGQYNFRNSPPESANYGKMGESDPGFLSGVSELVIGRVKEKKAVLEWVLGQSNNDATPKVLVLAIVGIGGMGKTTLARLVHKDDRVETRFKKNRWFVSISDTANDEEFVRKIYLSVTEGNGRDLPSGEVQRNKIEEALQREEFLLVLDNVWDDDRSRWHNRMGLLRGGENGGKIIVTTRSDLVATEVGARDTYKLGGLSDKESWDLLRSIVRFTPEQERDQWAVLGREIVEKGKNVPLAIRSIASLLSEKNTIQEWRSLRNEVLSKLGKDETNDIMRVLKFSYDHLSPTLKRCFAYISLFQKGTALYKETFVYLWISQGYVKARVDDQSIQEEELSCLMGLVRRSFLLPEVAHGGLVPAWKMHDLIHELAQGVAAEESIILKTRSTEVKCHRHLNVTAYPDQSWLDALPVSNFNRLRSFLYFGRGSSGSTLSLEPLLPKFKSLRALWLANLGIETVPSSIGELIHLRFLNISLNRFRELPDAITNLVNLCLLNVSGCKELEVFPSEFRRLANIRGLCTYGCDKLMGMPPGLEELTYLQDLTAFHVSREIERSKLDVLPTLDLKGLMEIVFHDDETDDWNEMEFWRPPPTLEWLSIKGYRGVRIPKWGNEPTLMITSLSLRSCSGVKCLPPLTHLPKLNYIDLKDLSNLEYIQEAEEEKEGSSILPNLKQLGLKNLESLRDWSTGQLTLGPRVPTIFPSLSDLIIEGCPNLNHFPSCPSLETLHLEFMKGEVLQHLMPKHISPPSDNTPKSSLDSVIIRHCNDLVIFPGESFTSLRSLSIIGCPKLKKVELPPLRFNNLQELTLFGCRELELWDENKICVRWDSLANITMLRLLETPSSGKLPDCLQQRIDSGLLQFQAW